jgi:hypothetical protein
MSMVSNFVADADQLKLAGHCLTAIGGTRPEAVPRHGCRDDRFLEPNGRWQRACEPDK